MAPSVFLRPIHPKTEIRPTAEAVRRILAAGWVAQTKIHGHRAQVHIPSDDDADIIVYNRQGQRHRKALSKPMQSELRRLFRPKTGWTVIDGEWLKPEDQLFVFDLLKLEGKLLRSLPFLKRYQLLPRAFISPTVKLLPLLDTEDKCMAVLEKASEHTEGLVFRSKNTPGFLDSSIIRCRRKGSRGI